MHALVKSVHEKFVDALEKSVHEEVYERSGKICS